MSWSLVMLWIFNPSEIPRWPCIFLLRHYVCVYYYLILHHKINNDYTCYSICITWLLDIRVSTCLTTNKAYVTLQKCHKNTDYRYPCLKQYYRLIYIYFIATQYDQLYCVRLITQSLERLVSYTVIQCIIQCGMYAH